MIWLSCSVVGADGQSEVGGDPFFSQSPWSAPGLGPWGRRIPSGGSWSALDLVAGTPSGFSEGALGGCRRRLWSGCYATRLGVPRGSPETNWGQGLACPARPGNRLLARARTPSHLAAGWRPGRYWAAVARRRPGGASGSRRSRPAPTHCKILPPASPAGAPPSLADHPKAARRAGPVRRRLKSASHDAHPRQ